MTQRPNSRERNRNRPRHLLLERLEPRVVLDGTAPLAADGNIVPEPPPDPALEIARFTDPTAAEDYVLKTSLERWGHLFGQPTWPWDILPYPIMTADALGGTEGDPASSRDSTNGTNVQEPGVDEGDLVKTDGQFIYWVGHRELTIVDLRDPTTPEIATQIPLDYQPQEIYLIGDRLTLLSHHDAFPPRPLEVDGTGAVPLTAHGEAATTEAGDVAAPMVAIPDSLWMPPWPVPWDPQVAMSVYDVSVPEQPSLLQTTVIDGRLLESRSVGDMVYVVVQGDGILPPPEIHCERVDPPVKTAPDGSGEGGAEVHLATGDSAPLDKMSQTIDGPIIWPHPKCVYESEQEYLDRVGDQVLNLALPNYRVLDDSGKVVDEGRLHQPDSLSYLVGRHEANLVSVVAIDVAADLPAVTSTAGGYLGAVSNVYATSQSVYVAGVDYGVDGEETRLFQFAISEDGRTVELAAAGTVPGRPLDQFSFDEHGGYLRVATTRGWGDHAENAVTVLQRQSQQLEVIGQVTGITPGETLYAARFLGDRGYLVTFRRVDPLLVIDLSEPQSPQLVGELVLPGFSNYLQEVAPDVIVGLGRHADEQSGRIGEPQVSLFDVRDAQHPRLLDRETIGESRWAHSEAFHEHHAISYFPDHQLLVIPFQLSGWLDDAATDAAATRRWMTRNEFWVFRVEPPPPDGSLAPMKDPLSVAARIVHPGPGRRSLQIDEYLVTLSHELLQVHRMSDPTKLVGQLPLVRVAVDDEFTVHGEREVAVLDVLANDRLGHAGYAVGIESVSVPESGGVAEIARDGRHVLYKAPADFVGDDRFTYTVAGQQATVIVHVIETPDVVRFRLEAVGADGQRLETAVVGEPFSVNVFVEDLRDNPGGVFAAYVDVRFDPELAEVSGPLVAGPEFPNGIFGVVHSDGLVDEVGGFAGLEPTGGGEHVLVTIAMTALRSGTLPLTIGAADELPQHEVGLYFHTGAVPPAAMDFVGLELPVEDGFHNVVEPADTNGDGSVSPLDALTVIDVLNTEGALPIAELRDRLHRRVQSLQGDSESRLPVRRYYDVNRDGFISPLDALMIIDRLNARVAAHRVEDGEGESFAAVAQRLRPMATVTAPLPADATDRSASAMSSDVPLELAHPVSPALPVVDASLEDVITDVARGREGGDRAWSDDWDDVFPRLGLDSDLI